MPGISNKIYDVIVIGGGPVGLSAAYELSKAGKSVAVLEKRIFFNSAGSSGDLARMYRTVYTEPFMADLAFKSMEHWNELEEEAGDNSIRIMSGLLNFGDPDYGAGGPEGTLMGPVENLERLHMPYKILTKTEIEAQYPFKNLPDNYVGLFSPDNGIINVPLLLRTLYRLAESYGAHLHQYTTVTKVEPCSGGWKVSSTNADGTSTIHTAAKLVIASGAYTNHILRPSFDMELDLNIWEMTATYYSVNPGPDPSATAFPSMWFQFAEDVDNESRLFYGFPVLPFGPPNLARISVDAASTQITDPDQRHTNVVNSDDVANVQKFIKERVVGVDDTVPAQALTCLQTNVFDNMFVLDFIPERYLRGGAKDSVAVFTAGWAMKFVPLLGKALKEMVVDGKSDLKMSEFSITRKDEEGKGIIVPVIDKEKVSGLTQMRGGSSIRRMGH